MTDATVLSVTLDGAAVLSPDQLKELYRLTGRSTVELREAVTEGAPLYAAELFGPDHVDVAPRLEKTVDLCRRHGLAFRLEETYEGETETITLDVMRDILEAAPGSA